MSDTLDAEDVIETDDAQSAPESQDSPEDKARRMGWKPKEELKDPSKHLSAEEFLERGESIMPILRANNKALEKSVADYKTELKDMKKTLAEFQKFATKAEQRGYASAMRELETQQAAAVEAGDADGVKAITKEMVALEKDARSDLPAQQDPRGWTDDYAEAVDDFRDANPWFDTDRTMTVWAKGLDNELKADGMEAKARLKEIARQAKAEFPDKFGNPARRNAAAVDGVTSSGTRRGGGKSWADLPPEAKAMADELVKGGKIAGYTREKYVSSYFGDAK